MSLGIDTLTPAYGPLQIRLGILDHAPVQDGVALVRVLPEDGQYPVRHRLNETPLRPVIVTLESPESFEDSDELNHAVLSAVRSVRDYPGVQGVALASDDWIRTGRANTFSDSLSTILPHLMWVELPFNLLEVNLHFEQPFSDGSSLAETLSKGGLPIHFRRVFDSFVGGRHIRWVGRPRLIDTTVAARVQVLLKTVIELELELQQLHPHAPIKNWGHTLGRQFQLLQGSWHWRRILQSKISRERDDWCREVSALGQIALSKRYQTETELLFHTLTTYFEAQESLFAEKVLSHLRNNVNDLPEIESLEELSLRTLLGLIRPEAIYIEQEMRDSVLPLLDRPTFSPGTAIEVLEHVRALIE